MRRFGYAALGLSATAALICWTFFKPVGRATVSSADEPAAGSGGSLNERVHHSEDVQDNGTEPVFTSRHPESKTPRIAAAVRDRARADRLRAALTRFWQDSERAPQARAATAGTVPPRSLAEWTEGDYVKSVLHDQYIPLARECYEEYLKRAPKGAGKVVVNFSITGTAELGGVIENVRLGEESTVKDEPFATCLAESMYALALDPPPEDSKGITVGYGVEFSPESPEEHARRESGNQGLDAPDQQPHNTKHR